MNRRCNGIIYLHPTRSGLRELVNAKADSLLSFGRRSNAFIKSGAGRIGHLPDPHFVVGLNPKARLSVARCRPIATALLNTRYPSERLMQHDCSFGRPMCMPFR